MPKGQLIKTAREKNLLSDVTILAASEQQAFANARIVTLHEIAHEMAVCDYVDNLPPGSVPGMVGDSDEVDYLLDTKYSQLREFVRVYEDEVVIGVNAVTIHGAAINHALQLMLKCDSLCVGTFVEFGDPIRLR